MEQEQNSALEFHDSEVASIVTSGGTVVVKSSAVYVHRSAGRPGVDAGAGYLQSLELICSGTSVAHKEEGCGGRSLDGLLTVDSLQMSLVPVPDEAFGEVTIGPLFTNGSRFRSD